MMVQLAAGITLSIATLALRSASVNRYIRSTLLISCALFAGYVVAAALLAYAPAARRSDLARDENRAARRG